MRFISAVAVFFLCVSSFAATDNGRKYVLNYSNERMETASISMKQVSELALSHNVEYYKIKTDRDAAAEKIDKALYSLFPSIRASAAMNTLDKDRPDYEEKAAQEKNPNAKIKLMQVLFSDSLFLAMDTAEYKTNAQRLVAETIRLDVDQDASLAYAQLIYANAKILNARKAIARAEDMRSALKNKNTSKAVLSAINKLGSDSAAALSAAEDFQKEADQKIAYLTGITPAQSCEYEDYDAAFINGISESLLDVITSDSNPKTQENIAAVLADAAIDSSPELKALDTIIKLNKRTIKSDQRKSLSPDISFTGEYTQFLEKQPDSDSYTANMDNSQWQMNLKLSIPLGSGGNNNPELYAKNVELMNYMRSRGEVRKLVKKRMTDALADIIKAQNQLSATKQAKADSEKRLALIYAQTAKKKTAGISLPQAAEALNTAEAALADAEAYRAESMIRIMRAYGKFLYLENDSSDQRLLDNLNALKAQGSPE